MKMQIHREGKLLLHFELKDGDTIVCVDGKNKVSKLWPDDNVNFVKTELTENEQIERMLEKFYDSIPTSLRLMLNNFVESILIKKPRDKYYYFATIDPEFSVYCVKNHETIEEAIRKVLNTSEYKNLFSPLGVVIDKKNACEVLKNKLVLYINNAIGVARSKGNKPMQQPKTYDYTS